MATENPAAQKRLTINRNEVAVLVHQMQSLLPGNRYPWQCPWREQYTAVDVLSRSAGFTACLYSPGTHVATRHTKQRFVL
jgi:hypothetical protein